MLKDAKMLKDDLIESLKENRYISKSDVGKLCIKLIKRFDENDLDFSEVLKDEMGYNIVELLVDCYDPSQFLNWLIDNDFDLFNNYRFSDRRYLNDFGSFEEFKKENEDIFYEDEPECLFINEDTGVYVYKW